MKTNLLFTKSLCVLAISTLLVSCSTSVNLSKKRYSNGYYVSVSHDVKEKAENQKATEYKNSIVVVSKEVKIEKEKSIEPLSVSPLPSTSTTKKVIETNPVPTATKISSPSIFKSVKKLKKAITKNEPGNDNGEMSDEFLIVLLLTIIIPPVGVYIFKQEIRPAIIDFLLIVIGIILAPLVAISLFYGLGYILGLVYGLLYIFEKI